jgi:hypothetical protein
MRAWFKLRVIKPKKVLWLSELVAPPLTQHFILVGTAYDYLLRFRLQREFPIARNRTWVAEFAVLGIREKLLKEEAKKALTYAKGEYQSFLSAGQLSDRLLDACLKLSQLDEVYRSGKVPEVFEEIDPLDINDLRALSEVTDLSLFKPKKVLLLNPTFGDASRMVGGADCDLVIDDTLIDIKTSKVPEVKRDDFNQLVGYYLLSQIGGIDDLSRRPKINKVGFYHSRFAKLLLYEIDEIIDRYERAYLIADFPYQCRLCTGGPDNPFGIPEAP